MKIYQTVHKYTKHIEYFEKHYGINDDTSFEEIQNYLINDGYCNVYHLKPEPTSEVFFTIWDYERLQLRWAKENGLNTKDLNQIKLAQIEHCKPDVFYNMSAFYDNKFINLLSKNKNRIDVCWNAIIEKQPTTFHEYDGHISLHKPFVDYWNNIGMPALELQPAIPDEWNHLENKNRDFDMLFYGQIFNGLFDKRINLLSELNTYSIINGLDFHLHLTYNPRFGLSKNPDSGIVYKVPTFPPLDLIQSSRPPLYGANLYEKISRSKIIINTCGDYNTEYKSNMRIFESIGLGSLLIAESGNYPIGLEPGIDFLTYSNSTELHRTISNVIRDWDQYAVIASNSQARIKKNFSKKNQWANFLEFIEKIYP